MTNTNHNDDRLDRIERILESVAQKTDSNALAIQALTQKTDSNARAIQAMAEQQATDRLKHEENIVVIRDAIQQLTKVEQGLANMMVGIDENQPSILRKLNSIENKVDTIIERDQYPPL